MFHIKHNKFKAAPIYGFNIFCKAAVIQIKSNSYFSSRTKHFRLTDIIYKYYILYVRVLAGLTVTRYRTSAAVSHVVTFNTNMWIHLHSHTVHTVPAPTAKVKTTTTRRRSLMFLWSSETGDVSVEQ